MRFLPSYFCLGLALASLGCGVVTEPASPKMLAQSYAAEFGQPPPAPVSHLKARQVVLCEDGGTWLRFEADSNVLAGIISSRFKPSDRATFLYRSGGENAPAWWKPEHDSVSVFYVCPHWGSGTNDCVAVMACDRARRVVYFHRGLPF